MFTKSVYEPNFAFCLGDFNFDICSPCLMFFIFCVSFFVGGLPHKKGVCIHDVFIVCVTSIKVAVK